MQQKVKKSPNVLWIKHLNDSIIFDHIFLSEITKQCNYK